MRMDDGMLTVCNLTLEASTGNMPVERLSPISRHFYGARTVGMNRQYAAMGVNERVDMLVRIWRDRNIHIGDYVLLEDGQQYRIDQVQQVDDEHGLPATDLSLSKLENNYAVKSE
ncbi:MAG TPA: hypothetical protein IAC31_09190 [Candidatus Faecousia intestinigallinarum]|nr:hypothetical protein [Candidatus Faecousia intestinigallinarum]